jgi:hypothetical protein
MRKELKDVILYGLCVPCGIYAIYEGFKLMGYISYIKENNPECYVPNPSRIEIFFGTIFVLAVLQFPLQAASRIYFERVLPENKFPKGSKERQVKVQMMAERMYRLFLYLAFSLIGFWIMKQGNFLHKYLLGSETNPQYFTGYPCQVLSRY